MNASIRALLLAIVILSCQTGFAIAENTNTPAVSGSENWENVSESASQTGTKDTKPDYLRPCKGLLVTPTGDIFMQTATKGICISKDQGSTWSVVADNAIAGRCEHGFAFSIAYPYDGRMAFFCYDGNRGRAGGMSLDGGATWNPFTQVVRGVEFGDVDWSARDSYTIIGMTHEPYFTVLSNNGGRFWQWVSDKPIPNNLGRIYGVGIINSKTLIRYNPTNNQGGVIELSEDVGQTWTQVATNYQVLGQRPVHYGQKVYWTTAQGVITSTNGKDWALTGAGAEGAKYGPYFGLTEQEFVVVTGKFFLKTEDGGATWKTIAKFYKAPDIGHNWDGYCYFGWDAQHNILYASGLGAAVYRLKL